MTIDPNEIPITPESDGEIPKERRDARLRWEIGSSKRDAHIDFADVDPAVVAELSELLKQINELWDKLDEDRRNGVLLLKDDVDRVLQIIDALYLIFADDKVKEMRRQYLSEHPDAGIKNR